MKDTTWLVLRLSALGDCVLTTGVMRYWHERHDMNFCVVTRAAFAPVFENNPVISQIVGVRESDLSTLAWFRFCLRLRKKMGHLPVLDLHGNLRSRILRTLWPSPCYCYPKKGLERRLFQRIRGIRSSGLATKLLEHNVPQRYAKVLTTPPPDASLLRPHITLTDQEKKWAENFLNELGIHQPPVLLHPYAKHDNKTWPPEKWKELTNVLEKQGKNWLVIGRSQAALLPAANHDLTNQTNLRQTCALIAQARAFVSADSGPMHLATALQTPVVGLFGPTTRHWGFFPSGEKDKVLEKNLPCRPCSLHGKKDCPHNQRCLQEISIADVLEAISPFA